MDICILLPLLAFSLCPVTPTGHDTNFQDYCLQDGFHAHCPTGEILLVQEAIYGRMEIGSCITLAVGINCQSDVLQYMDAWCSGQQTCQVDIRDFGKLTDDCLPELNGYLRARYTCLQVVRFDDQCCSLREEHIHIPLNGNYIVSSVEQAPGCGIDTCPMVIQAPTGQQINISIYNFNTSSEAIHGSITVGSDQHSNQCFAYANIKEEGIRITLALCVDGVRRRHLYASSTNRVEIRINIETGIDLSRSVFKFEAIGCPTPVPPENGYIEQHGQLATVRCVGLDDMLWEITCDHNEWKGSIGNCPTTGVTDLVHNNIAKEDKTKFPKVFIIAMILTLAILISIGIILIGLAYVRRYRRNRASSMRQQFYPNDRSPYYHRTDQCSEALNHRNNMEIQNTHVSYSESNLDNFDNRHTAQMEKDSKKYHTSTAGINFKGNYPDLYTFAPK